MLQIIFIVYASYKLLSYIWSLVSGSAYKCAHDKLEASAMIVGTTIGFVSVTALSIIAAVYPTTSFAFVLAIVLTAIHGVGALILVACEHFWRAIINIALMTLFIVSLVIGA